MTYAEYKNKAEYKNGELIDRIVRAVRNVTIEQCATVAENLTAACPDEEVGYEIAAAIRALKDKP